MVTFATRIFIKMPFFDPFLPFFWQFLLTRAAHTHFWGAPEFFQILDPPKSVKIDPFFRPKTTPFLLFFRNLKLWPPRNSYITFPTFSDQMHVKVFCFLTFLTHEILIFFDLHFPVFLRSKRSFYHVKVFAQKRAKNDPFWGSKSRFLPFPRKEFIPPFSLLLPYKLDFLAFLPHVFLRAFSLLSPIKSCKSVAFLTPFTPCFS